MDYTINHGNDVTNIHDHLTNARSGLYNVGNGIVKLSIEGPFDNHAFPCIEPINLMWDSKLPIVTVDV